MFLYQMHFVCKYACPARPAAGRFSLFRLRGTQAARVYTTAQVSVPAELRGVRSGRAKSRHLASNHGIAIRLAEPRRTMEIPQCSIFALLLLYHAVCITPSLKLSSSTLRQTLSNSSRTSSSSFCDGHGHCICVRVGVSAMFPVD